MIDIKNFRKYAFENLKKIDVGNKIELLTFKKDRKVTIEKIDQDIFNVIQDGFEYKQFYNLDSKKLEKALKQIQRAEFPRSNKVFLKIIKWKK